MLRLVADLQSENQAGGGLPLLVAADQEGGVVTRLGFGTSGIGNGIGIGAISYVVIALCTGKYKKKDIVVTIIAILFALKFALVYM